MRFRSKGRGTAKMIETGTVFGLLRVTGRAVGRTGMAPGAYWATVCTRCGREANVLGSNLRRGLTKSCPCSREPSRPTHKAIATGRKQPHPHLVPGEHYGQLTILDAREWNSTDLVWVVRCQCACGNKHIARESSIRRGHTRSCGCLRVENVRRIHLARRKEAAE